jgi:hypothetical protein
MNNFGKKERKTRTKLKKGQKEIKKDTKGGRVN